MKPTASGGTNSSANAISIEMTNEPKKHAPFVVCIRNEGYAASLELHKIYRVLPDDAAEADGDLRVVDESGEDYLFPASYFAPIDVPTAVAESLSQAS